MAQSIIWTALPRGLRYRAGAGWQAGLSLFVSPRLDVAGGSVPLGEFKDFIDWPQIAGAARFWLCLRRAGEPAGDPVEISPLSGGGAAAPDSAAWQALFAAGAPVRPYDTGGARARAAVLAYDAAEVSRAVRRYYVQSLNDGAKGEWGAGMRAAGAPFLANQPPPSGDRITIPALIDAWSRAADNSAVGAFERFCLFHRVIDSTLGTGTAEDNGLDFHGAVSAMGSYPALLRKLGLAFDFELPLQTLGEMAFDSLCIVAKAALQDATTHCRPWTAVELRVPAGPSPGPGIFLPRAQHPERGEYLDGFLQVARSDAALIQEQLDNAAFSLLDFARSTARATSLRPQAPVASGSFRRSFEVPPALLTAGMSLADRRLAGGLRAALEGQVGKEAWLAASRPDPAAPEAGEALDEGRDLDPDAPTLYAEDLVRGYRVDVHDESEQVWRSLCRRSGRFETGKGWRWSPGPEDEGIVGISAGEDRDPTATVLRPNQALFTWDGWSLVVPRPGSALGDGAAAESDDARPDPNYPLTASFKATPGSLPRQRFGRAYRFRLRAVDLAGNSWSLQEADVLAGEPDKRGLVTRPERCLRHEPVLPPAVLPAQPRGDGEAGDVLVIRDFDRSPRAKPAALFVVPPKISLELAEWHGLFDDYSPQQSWTIIKNHDGDLPDDNDHAAIKKLTSGTGIGAALRVPYLPDPLCHRAVLVDLPGSAEPLQAPEFVPRSGKVSLATSFSLALSPAVRSGQKPRINRRQVTVFMDKGRSRSIKIAAQPGPADLETLALSSWFADAEPSLAPRTGTARDQRAALGNAVKKLAPCVAAGRMPMIAPAREILLVHAVQRPVAAPVFGRPAVIRKPYGNGAELFDKGFGLDLPSTGRLDLVARWDDTVDDPADPGWRREAGELQAFGMDLAEDAGNPLDPAARSDEAAERLPATAHSFPDGKARLVTYEAIARTRFAEYYPEALTKDPENTVRKTEAKAIIVPSTAPPAPPKLSYIVPTFRRQWTSAGKARQRALKAQRFGGGLRLFLERGWFSSGYGEQLALVFPMDARGALPEGPGIALSQWALNPLKRAEPPPPRLLTKHLRGAPATIPSYEIAAPQGTADKPAAVALAVYDVRLDEDRGLLYCDVELDPGQTFFPLVRLALARYQPHALPGMELSAIVPADFMALAPDRLLTLRRPDSKTLALTLAGPSYLDEAVRAAGRTPTSLVRARLERAAPGIADPVLKWEAVEGSGIELEAGQSGGDTWVWRGRMPLTGPAGRGRRLVVEEFELFTAPDGATAETAVERLIYAEAVPLDSPA